MTNTRPDPREIIVHPAFETARAEARGFLERAQPGEVIFVPGLSGSGKSEIRWDLMRYFAGRPSEWAPGTMPAAMLLATQTDKGLFNSKDFARRLWQTSVDPTLEWLKSRHDIDDPDIVHRINQARLDGPKWTTSRTYFTESDMLERFITAASQRKLKALFIEQGGTLADVPRSWNPSRYMIGLLTTALRAGLVLVIFGIPTIGVLWSDSQEVARRKYVAPIRRYEIGRPADVAALEGLIVTLARRETEGVRRSLLEHIDEIYVGTLGIFDELRRIIDLSTNRMRQRGGRKVSRTDIRQSFRTQAEMETMYRDAKVLDEVTKPADVDLIRSLTRVLRKEGT